MLGFVEFVEDILQTLAQNKSLKNVEFILVILPNCPQYWIVMEG